MSPSHYTATFDDATGKWFFTTPERRYSGFRFQGTCQGLANSMKRAAQLADSPKVKSRR